MTKPIFLGLLSMGLIALMSRVQASPVSTEGPPLVLSPGEQRMLQIPGFVRFSLGSDVVRALKTRDSEALLLKGIHPGGGDLWVWKSDGSSEHRSVQVERVGGNDLKPGLARALGQLQEAEVYYSGIGVVLRGEIRSLAEAARIEALAKGFPREIVDETEPSDALLTEARHRIEGWIRGSPFASRLEVQRIDRMIRVDLVQGALKGPAEKALVEKRIRGLYPLAVINADALPDDSPTVHFKVFLLELRKTRFHTLGLGWPAAQEGAFRVTTSAIQNLLQLDVALQALEGDGSARILSNPELVVRAPGEAELFSGGEIPIHLESQYYANVSWKSFGLMLKLNVTHSAGDRVRLDVFTEVSRLDRTLGSGDEKIPGIQANRMKTQVDARYGTPLLLSGLLQQGMHRQARGLPWLRDIPILGLLFGSEDYLNDRSELVAILVPSRELPAAPMDRVTRFFPRGPMPPAREPARPDEERRARESPDYPWNVLQ